MGVLDLALTLYFKPSPNPSLREGDLFLHFLQREDAGFYFLSLYNYLMTLENLTNKRKRLIFRSWHRGMKEMDQIMGSFANQYVPNFSEAELDLYEQLLENSDPEMYDWICGRVEAPANKNSVILEKLLGYDYATTRSTGSDEANIG